MSEGKHAPRVFLCHSSGDKATVRELYGRLRADGINPWFDEVNLLPGKAWELEIAAAVRGCDFVAVCFSQKSVNKVGYIQKEITVALEEAERKPEGAIFIIPVRLEDGVQVPNRLRKWQWANLFEHDGYQKFVFILKTLGAARGRDLALMLRLGPPLQSTNAQNHDYSAQHGGFWTTRRVQIT